VEGARDDRHGEVEGVHKSFGPVEVLKGIDLEVNTGEVVLPHRPVGSGKSTFLRCINHLEKSTRAPVRRRELVGYRQKATSCTSSRTARSR